MENLPPEVACREALAVDVALTRVGRATATGEAGEVNVGDVGDVRVGKGNGEVELEVGIGRGGEGEGATLGGDVEVEGVAGVREGVPAGAGTCAADDSAMRDVKEGDLNIVRDVGLVTGDIGGVGGVCIAAAGDIHIFTVLQASARLSCQLLRRGYAPYSSSSLQIEFGSDNVDDCLGGHRLSQLVQPRLYICE